MASYNEERRGDIATIEALVESGEIPDTIEARMQEAWAFGWTTGFGFQGTVEDSVIYQRELSERDRGRQVDTVHLPGEGSKSTAGG